MATKNIRTRRKKSKKQKNHLFWLGLLMFLVGLFGFLYATFFQFHSAAEIAPKNTTFLAQIQNSTKPEHFPLDLLPLPLKALSEKISANNTDWVGKNSAVVVVQKDLSALLVEYQSKEKAKAFLAKNFLVENERFIPKEMNGVAYQTAQFSSNLSYFFKDNWLILTTNQNIIPLFSEENSLANTNEWESFIEQKNRSEKNLVFVSLTNLEKQFSSIFQDPAKNALLTGTSNLFSHAGMSKSDKNTQITLFRTKEVAEKTTAKDSFVPEIFSFIPKNPAFLISGTDLYQETQNLKKSFETAHPQYGILFEQVLPQVFGDIFLQSPDNFKKFTEKLHGQFAVVSEKNKTGGLETAFISRFGIDTQDEKIKTLNKILTETQANLTPTVKTVELPNGKTRKELVAVANNVQVKKDGNLHSLVTENAQTGLSYGFRDGYLVISTSKPLAKKILSTQANQSITNQKSFRNFVLYNSKSADSYGIIQPKTITDWLKIKESKNGKNSFILPFFSFLSPTDTTVFFHRKSDKNTIKWNIERAE